MMKNRIMKILIYTFVFMICFSFLTNAMALSYSTPAEEISSAHTHLSEDNGQNDVYSTLRKIASVLSIFAFIICVFKLAQIGFKFMFGVANKRSDAMQSLLPWAIGVFICTSWLTLGNWIMMTIIQDNSLVGPGPFDLPTWLGF